MGRQISKGTAQHPPQNGDCPGWSSVIAATVYDTDGEEVTGLVIGDQVLAWHRGDPQLHPIAAVLHECEATTVKEQFRQLAGWLSTRAPLTWAHLVDALLTIGDNLVPVGPGPVTGPVQPSVPRPLAPVRAGWFVD
jgi:hypothetical protein